MTFAPKINPCLWFDGQAHEAAQFYTSIFANSKITNVHYYGEVGQDITGGKPGSVLTTNFEINGMSFIALNGGSHFKFTPAISFQIDCKDQAEVDYYWEKLGEGGNEKAQQCGWVADKFGVSWQVVPIKLPELLQSKDKGVRDRTMAAMMKMKKLDVEGLQRAADGKE